MSDTTPGPDRDATTDPVPPEDDPGTGSADSAGAGAILGERGLWYLIAAIGVALTAYMFVYAYQRPFVRVRHSNIFLGAGLALFYLYESKKHLYGTDDVAAFRDRDVEYGDAFTGRLRATFGPYDGYVTLVSAALAVAAALYVELSFDRLQFDAPVLGYSQPDFLVGALIIALVADATRRAYGFAITSVVFVAIGYAMAGPWLPGFLGHTGMSWQDVARFGAIGLSGTYGFILGVGTTWVAIFIMFAGMAKSYGALDYILDVGGELGNNLRTGVVQAAVVSSMAMGSITGSAAANTATTGSFTIPMMQRQGVREDFAAAIESVASSGGQMMPPVMGVAAFIMADILQLPYVRIIQAGLLPALLFYFSVAVAVQFVVLKFGWTTEKTGEFDRSVLGDGAHFAIGHRDARGWVTEGWWNLDPRACETLLEGALASRFYYVYAVDYDRGGEWGGRTPMCTREREFTVRGVEDCLARGFDRNGFFEVDTGQQRSWTIQLTDPDRPGAALR